MIFFLDAGVDTDSTQIRRKQTCMDTEALRFVITDDLKAVIFGTHLEGDGKPIAPLKPATLLQQCMSRNLWCHAGHSTLPFNLHCITAVDEKSEPTR